MFEADFINGLTFPLPKFHQLVRLYRLPLSVASIKLLIGCTEDQLTAMIRYGVPLGKRIVFAPFTTTEQLQLLARLAQGRSELELSTEEQDRVATLLFEEVSAELTEARSDAEIKTKRIEEQDAELFTLNLRVAELTAPKPEEPVDPNALTKDQIAVMRKRLDETDLPPYMLSYLYRGGFVQIWQLVEKTPAELRKTKDIGRKSVRDIEVFLAPFGLRLGRKFDRTIFTGPPAE